MRLFAFACLLVSSIVLAEEWPVQFTWDYPQPVPADVTFRLYEQTEGSLALVAETRNLAAVVQRDYAELGACGLVEVLRAGVVVDRLVPGQIRLPDGALPALQRCRMGGDCPGQEALRQMLREDSQ